MELNEFSGRKCTYIEIYCMREKYIIESGLGLNFGSGVNIFPLHIRLSLNPHFHIKGDFCKNSICHKVISFEEFIENKQRYLNELIIEKL